MTEEQEYELLMDVFRACKSKPSLMKDIVLNATQGCITNAKEANSRAVDFEVASNVLYGHIHDGTWTKKHAINLLKDKINQNPGQCRVVWDDDMKSDDNIDQSSRNAVDKNNEFHISNDY